MKQLKIHTGAYAIFRKILRAILLVPFIFLIVPAAGIAQIGGQRDFDF